MSLFDSLDETAMTRLSAEDVAAGRLRRWAAMRLQAIEGNPLDAEDTAMFEMFERERWSHERCIAYILAHAKDDPVSAAAE